MPKTYGHESLFAYPTDLNAPADILLAKASGEDVPLNCCVHAAIQIECVAAGMLFPDTGDGGPTTRATTGAVECPSDEEAKKLLHEVKLKKGPLTDMLLKQLLAYAIAKLNEWLNFK